MSDVELIIKIPEEVKEAFDNANMADVDCYVNDYDLILGKAIKNCITLPKGHGGLIGVQDAVDNLMEYKEIGIFGNYDKLTILGCIDRIENHVNPIIEDKEDRK